MKQQEICALKSELAVINKSNESLRLQVSKLMDDEKEYEITIQKLNDEIVDLKLKCIEVMNYEDWNPREIVMWIMSLDNNRFNKYKDALSRHLNEEEIIGSDLKEINEIDLQRWKITSFRDKKLLLQRIKELTERNDNNNDVAIANEEEGAETGEYHR